MTERQGEPLWRTGLTVSPGGGRACKFGSFHLQLQSRDVSRSAQVTGSAHCTDFVRGMRFQLCISSNWFLIFFFFLKKVTPLTDPVFTSVKWKVLCRLGKKIKPQYHTCKRVYLSESQLLPTFQGCSRMQARHPEEVPLTHGGSNEITPVPQERRGNDCPVNVIRFFFYIWQSSERGIN